MSAFYFGLLFISESCISLVSFIQASFGACLDGWRDFEVGVELGLVEGRPTDPHVEEGEPGEAARHAHVGALHGLIAGAGADVEGQE